jgi:hypothetical protein
MKIDFEFQTQYGVFKDALHLGESHGLTQAEIEVLKEERLNKWLHNIQNPPQSEPEKETIEIDGVVYEKIEIDGQFVLKPLEE